LAVLRIIYFPFVGDSPDARMPEEVGRIRIIMLMSVKIAEREQ